MNINVIHLLASGTEIPVTVLTKVEQEDDPDFEYMEYRDDPEKFGGKL